MISVILQNLYLNLLCIKVEERMTIVCHSGPHVGLTQAVFFS